MSNFWIGFGSDLDRDGDKAVNLPSILCKVNTDKISGPTSGSRSRRQLPTFCKRALCSAMPPATNMLRKKYF